jgi:SAM-dependent methyltransferase
MATKTYSSDFYETIRQGCRSSADAVVPEFLKHYRPESVVDVGCGEGWWGSAFRDAGADVIGLDGGEVADPPIVVEQTDLTDFGIERGTADLAIALEVAEHLPEEAAGEFVEMLCNMAPVVLFSAAIPGQGGVAHLNEQWPSYWVERFETNGHRVTGDFRWRIWNDDRIENWYRQNILIACAEPIPAGFSEGFSFNGALPVVHPVLFDARRQ